MRAPYPLSMAVIYWGKASERLACCQRQTIAYSAWKRMSYRGFYSQSLAFITVLVYCMLKLIINVSSCILDLLLCMFQVHKSLFVTQFASYLCTQRQFFFSFCLKSLNLWNYLTYCFFSAHTFLYAIRAEVYHDRSWDFTFFFSDVAINAEHLGTNLHCCWAVDVRLWNVTLLNSWSLPTAPPCWLWEH